MASKPVSVTVRYFKPGTQPPVFVAGSFSDPEWQPQEMQHNPKGEGFEYYKEVEIEAGKEYQFKFRIGNGDWWVLDEEFPTVTDDAGNRNNLLTIPISKETADEKEVDDVSSNVTVAEETTAPATSNMDDADAKSIEERMGTREPSDVLFDDEIVKDAIGGQAPTTQETPETKSDWLSNTESSKGEHVEINLDEKTPVTTEPESEVKESENANEPTTESTEKPSATEGSTPEHVLEQQEIESAEVEPLADTQESSPTPDSIHEGTKEPLPTPAVEDKQLEIEINEEEKQIDVGAKEDSLSPNVFLSNVRQSEDSATEVLAPKAVQHLRAEFAGSDYRSQTPELAAVASEVADSAAELDRDQPTPPVSDEEAGRIGYRRLSSTPIPQVAATAAEVADIAADLDRDQHTPPISDEEAGQSGLRRLSHTPIPQVADTAAEVADVAADLDREDQQYVFVEDPYIPGLRVPLTPENETPESEKGPKLPHEVPTPPDHLEPAQEQVVELPGPPSYIPRVPDPNDPSYEPFPTDRAGIMEQLRLLQERLPEDEVKIDIPISPSLSGNHNAGKQLPEPAPIIAAGEPSPLLEPISEENDEEQDEIQNPPEAPEAIDVDRSSKEVLDNVDIGSSKAEDVSSTTEGDTHIKEVSNSFLAMTAEPEAAKVLPSENTEVTGDAAENVPKVALEIAPEVAVLELTIAEEAVPKREEGAANSEPTIVEPVIGITRANTDGTDEGVPLRTPEEDQGKHDVEVRAPNHPVLNGNKLFAGIPSGSGYFAPSPITPFVVGDRQLGHEDTAHEIRTVQDSPNITFSPATPGSSISATDHFEKPMTEDEAKSTGIDDESGTSQIKARKPYPPTPPERPITPQSMRSAGKEARERNFLKAFWRVVFVDWIGGFIFRLCGGGRGRTALMAVGTIALLAVGPALYYLR